MRKIAFLSTALFIASPITMANELETITVTGQRMPVSYGKQAINTAVISAEEIQLLGATHINESLSRAPGTWISRGNGQEHLTALRSPVLTGAGACGAFLMAQDGIALRAPGFCNINQLFEVNSAQAQRIEVVRGPASALYGSNAVHGLINIITPEANDPLTSSLGFEVGSHGYQRSKLSYSLAGESQQLKVYGQGTSDKGYKDDAGFDQQKLNVIHYFQGSNFDTKTVLAASNINQETAGFVRGDGAYFDDNRRRENPNPEAYRDAKSLRLYSRINLTLDNNSSVQITPYFRSSRMSFLQHFLPWQPVEDNGVHSLGVKAQYQRQFDQLLLTTGLDIDSSKGYLKENQLADFSPSKPAGIHYDYKVDARVIAPFINARWSLSDATHINAGLRYESTQYDYDNQTGTGSACAASVTNCRFTRPADSKDSFSEWSPRISVLHEINDNHVSYLRLASGYRAPQATELYRLQQGQLKTDLNAESIKSIELGFKGQFQSLYYDIAVYSMKKSNVIFQDSDRRNISNGKTRHSGLETTLQYAINTQWQLAMNASIARHRYANSIQISSQDINGNDIDTAPKVIANTRLKWTPDLPVQAELEWVYLGAYYQNPENSQRYPGHSLINARFNWDVSANWRTQLRISNLANRKYAERADFAFGSDRYFIGEPRTIIVGVDYKFNR